MKVLHIITGTNAAGAEKTLHRLCIELRRRCQVDSEILSLRPKGPIAQRLEADRFQVNSLNLNRPLLSPVSLHRLSTIMKVTRANLHLAWMYHSAIAVELAYQLGRFDQPRLWTLRQALGNYKSEKLLTKVAIKLCAKLSSKPNRIIYNSKRAKIEHEAFGFDRNKGVVITNGYSFELTRNREKLKRQFVEKYGLDIGARYIGHLARFHPVKRHADFLTSLGRLKHILNFRILMAGEGVEESNTELMRLIHRSDLEDRVQCLGPIDDIGGFFSTLSLFVLSSEMESFPNVLIEAIAFGCPIVSTDVGDVKDVVGEGVALVPPRNPELLAEQIKDALIALDRGEKGQLDLADSILETHSIEKMTDHFYRIFLAALKGEAYSECAE